VATSAAIVAAEPQKNASLMTVIERLSSNPNVDIDKIQKLLEMQERWEVNRDKSSLRHAVAEFKKNPPQIIKQRVAKVKPKDDSKFEFTYSYADLENITSAIQDGLAERGVTHSWTMAEGNGGISVTCVLKYGMYEEPGVTLTAPPDQSGAKNAIQAKGSTISYLEKYTLLAATGMAAGMPDTDGNAAAPKMDRDAHTDAMTLIQGAPTLAELKNVWQAAVKGARAAKDAASEKDFTEAKELRKGQLENGQQ
jgi:ERF superfamily